MSLKSTSVVLIAFVVALTSFGSFAEKFPSFNKQRDMSKILYRALTSNGLETAVRLDGKNYNVTISADVFSKLFVDAGFAEPLNKLQAQFVTESDMRAWLAFYSEGLESKTLTFKRKAYDKAIKKLTPAATPTEAEITEFLGELNTKAKTLKASNANVIDELEELTELDKKIGLFKKTTLSADGKTQTYAVTIGGVSKTFTLTKV